MKNKIVIICTIIILMLSNQTTHAEVVQNNSIQNEMFSNIEHWFGIYQEYLELPNDSEIKNKHNLEILKKN